MDAGEVGGLLHEMMLVTLKLGGPVLLTALAVGVVMSLVQAITQVNEATLAFVPKAAAIVGVLALASPFMLATLSDYTQLLFDRIVAIGGQ